MGLVSGLMLGLAEEMLLHRPAAATRHVGLKHPIGTSAALTEPARRERDRVDGETSLKVEVTHAIERINQRTDEEIMTSPLPVSSKAGQPAVVTMAVAHALQSTDAAATTPRMERREAGTWLGAHEEDRHGSPDGRHAATRRLRDHMRVSGGE